MEYLSVLWFTLITVGCVCGTFSQQLSANLFQRIGMGIASIWSVWCIQIISNTGTLDSSLGFAACAVGFYSLGTLFKIYKYRDISK